MLVCHAEDSIKDCLLSLREHYALVERRTRDRRRKQKDLPETIELAIKMKVMITSNITINLDIMNGARGTVADIILNPQEPPLGDAPVVELNYLPQCVLIKLNRACHATRQSRRRRYTDISCQIININYPPEEVKNCDTYQIPHHGRLRPHRLSLSRPNDTTSHR